MSSMKTNSHRQESLEKLSTVVIQVLREISSQKRALTPATLSQALIQQKDLGAIFGDRELTRTDTPEPSLSLPSREDLSRLREEIRRLKLNKNRLDRQISELEDAKNQNDQFFRRALMTMVTVIMNPLDANLQILLLQMRELLRADADLATIKELYGQLKNTVLSQGVSDSLQEEGGGGSERGFMRNSTSTAKKSFRSNGAGDELYCREVQQFYQDILQLLPSELGDACRQRSQVLQGVLRSGLDSEQLLSMKREVLLLLNASFKNILDEKKQVANFLSEVGNNLSHIESLLLSSHGSSEAHVKSNNDFGRLIEGHMDEIRDSLAATDTLTGLKNLVLSKMTTIKAALEAKRIADAKELKIANARLGALQEKIQKVRLEIDQVQQQAKKLEKEILQDPLTGVNNRRAYEKKIQEEFQRFERYGQVFSLLLFDVDRFKDVNDRFGHTAGDRCLKEISARVREIIRVSDFIARYGGDEFVILLPGTGRDSLDALAEKVRGAVERLRFLYQGLPIDLSLSLGGTEVSRADSDVESLFNRADNALFQAKKAGRNRAVIL